MASYGLGYALTHSRPMAAALATAKPVNTVVPSIIGAAQDGQTLTGDNGSWDQPVSSYAYKWQTSADGSTGWTDISGAISASYAQVSGDVGNYLRRGVLASNSFGAAVAGYAFSVAAGPVASSGAAGVISFDWSDPNSSITFGL